MTDAEREPDADPGTEPRAESPAPADATPQPTEPAPRRAADRDAPPSTQLMVLGWCLWLLGSWAVSMLIASRVPAARWMVLSAVVGLMLMWPVVRLSERTPRGGRASILPGVLVEWLCLVLVFQAVVWPLRVISDWRTDQTVWLDLAVVGWSLLTAALVALGLQWRRPVPRTAMMGLCALLVVGEPMVMWLAGVVGLGAAWSMRVSPLETVWMLSHPIAAVRLAPWPGRVLTAAVAGVLAWVVLAVMSGLAGSGTMGRRD